MALFFLLFFWRKTSLVLNLSTLENEFYLVCCFGGKVNTHIHQCTIQDRVGPSFRLVDGLFKQFLSDTDSIIYGFVGVIS